VVRGFDMKTLRL